MREELSHSADSRDTAAIAASVVALALAKIYWLSRLGFDNPILPVVWTLGLSLFLIVAPLWLSRALRRRGSESWWKSQAFLAIGCIVITAMAGMLADATSFSVVPLLGGAGIALAVITLVRWFARGRAVKSIGFVLAVGVFAVWCAGVIWGSRYKIPLFWETLAYKANVHHDTFYYASIANMIDTYGVPSTGIDGVPLIRYHYGSAWLFDQWAHLLGMDVLTFYSLGYPLVVLPLFFSSLFQLSAELGARLRDDWRAWIVFLGATVGFLPTVALDSLAVWNSNAFISESYLMGMPVFLMALGTGLAFSRDSRRGARDWMFYLVFVPVILSALGFLKISLMIMGFAVAAYLALRKSLYRQPIVLASAVIASMVAGYTYHLVSLPAQNGGLSPLHFMRFDARQGWQQFFPLIHFLWTWLYVGARLWEERISDLSLLRSAVRERSILDVEVLLLVAVLGFLPGEIVSIHGGSAVYFSDVQRWLALSLIMARTAVWAGLVPKTETGVRTLKLSSILFVFVVAPFVITLFVNLAQWPVRVLRTNLNTRHELAVTPRDSTYYPIITALRGIAELPESERRESLLFIPQSNHQYWSMFTADGRCTFTPLIAPGIASVAMIDGMPATGCEITDQYNMTLYKRRQRPQLPQDMNSETLCEHAREKGFRYVIVLEAPGREIPRRQRLDCYLHKT